MSAVPTFACPMCGEQVQMIDGTAHHICRKTEPAMTAPEPTRPAVAALAAAEEVGDRWYGYGHGPNNIHPAESLPCGVCDVLREFRAALATTGEGEHVAREVFSADGIPFVRCSCTNTKSPTSSRWLSEHVPNGGVVELQAVIKRQAEGAKA